MVTSIARWLLDEASSGTGPSTVADSEGSNDLTIDYSSGDAAWSSIGAGNGLDFTATAGGVDTAVAELADIAGNGEIGSSLDGATTISLLAVVDVDNGASVVSRMFYVGTSSGDGDFSLLHDDSNLVVRFDNDGDFQTEVLYPSIAGSGVTVVAVVVDTTETTDTDRIKVWYDGSLQTRVDGGGWPAEDESLDLVNASDRSACIGNRPSGDRNIDGKIYYVELFTGALTGTEISDSNTALGSNNDANWVGGGIPILAFNHYQHNIG